jgi:hypothetical protein
MNGRKLHTWINNANIPLHMCDYFHLFLQPGKDKIREDVSDALSKPEKMYV